MPSAKPISFVVFSQKLMTLYTSALRAGKTRQKMRQVLDELANHGARKTSDLTLDFFAGWVEKRSQEVSPNTVIGLLGYTRAACSFAVEMGWLDRQPNWKRIRPRKADPATAFALQPDEIARLLDHLKSLSCVWSQHRLYALTSLVALTGLRRNEALCCKVADIDLERRVVWVRANEHNRLKTTASAAPVPLCDELVEVLEDWLKVCVGEWLFPGRRHQGPWVEGSLGYRPSDRLKEAAAAVGIERIGFHALRRTWATTALTVWCLPLWVIKTVLRHTSELTTGLYLSPTQREIVQRVKLISFRQPSQERAA